MTTQEVADRLVALCRKGEFETALMELYHDDAESIEPYATPDFEKVTKGKSSLVAKGEKFQGMTEQIHSIQMSDPLVAGNAFACRMWMDISIKGKGRMEMDELCVYQVRDGKVISEQFFV